MGYTMDDELSIYHNGEEINFILRTRVDGKYTSYKVIFEYRGVKVDSFFNKSFDKYYTYIPKVCDCIDKLGSEGVGKYTRYYDEYYSILKHNIVLNDTVYEYFHDNSVSSGQLRHNMMVIVMEDGTRLDNYPKFNQDYLPDPFQKDVYNFNKSFRNIKEDTENYYKAKGVLPKKEYIEISKTEKIQKIIKWANENKVHL